MNKITTSFSDIDNYHASQPTELRKTLEHLRRAIRQAAPLASETISYGMPAFRQHKVLVYYSAHKGHIGFYPTTSPIVHFKKELENYNTSKGAIQFPMDKPLPLSLIKKIVKFRLDEDKKEALKKPLKETTTKAPKIDYAILSYNNKQAATDRDICQFLMQEISNALNSSVNKLWHGHPVWFLDGNPIVGYSKQKSGIRLMFWSGASFDEPGLKSHGKKFKDASIFYNDLKEIKKRELKCWLKKSKEIMWDYKNIVKRKGKLERIK